MNVPICKECKFYLSITHRHGTISELCKNPKYQKYDLINGEKHKIHCRDNRYDVYGCGFTGSGFEPKEELKEEIKIEVKEAKKENIWRKILRK